jgi:O-antigen/teichoic acid export membrane protein
MTEIVPTGTDPLKPRDAESAVTSGTTFQPGTHNRHFATNHLMADLKGRSVRGGAVTLVSQGIKFALQMGSTMILARLLAPSDFGLVAMVAAITGLVAMFKDAGLSMATVQRQDITHDQVSTLFWINLGLTAVVTLVIAALAPAVAAFYAEPRLVWITLALAGTMLFGGLTVQHDALLRRQMRFEGLAVVELVTMAIGIAVGVTMAMMGFGYWALVAMTGAGSLANAVLVWRLCHWRPGKPKLGSGVGSMLRYGGGLTGFNFLNYFTRNADNVIVGFALGSGPLGIYSKAYGLLMMPIRQINVPVHSVMMPALSRLQDDPARYRRAYLRAISAIAMAGMPIVVCAWVLADEAVAILLGPGWEEAADVFRWLGPAAFFGTINVAPGWLCLSLGRASTQVRWALIAAPITVFAFLIGVQFGIVGVAAAFSASWCLGLYIFIAMACRGTPVRQRDIAAAIAPQVLASLVAAGLGQASLATLAGTVPEMTVRVGIVLPIIVVAYVAVLWMVPTSRTQLTALLKDGLRSAVTAAKEPT